MLKSLTILSKFVYSFSRHIVLACLFYSQSIDFVDSLVCVEYISTGRKRVLHKERKLSCLLFENRKAGVSFRISLITLLIN